MIDLHRLLRAQDDVFLALSRRGLPPQWLAELASLATRRREAQHAKEAAQAALNSSAAALQTRLRAGEKDAVAAGREAIKASKKAAQALEQAFVDADAACQARLLEVPNLPADDVPNGQNEADNLEVARVGTAKSWPAAKEHWDLAEPLGLLDFARASRTSGPRFAYLLQAGAKLERALSQFMLDLAGQHGFCEVSPPLLVRPEAMVASGQYPKFVGESFETDGREYVLIPTSEVPLLSLHAGEILPEEALPLRYAALTPCFRREAGAAGRDTRGLIRQHQFYKVELVTFCTAEQSALEHERLVEQACRVLEALELPYRKVHLCAGDLGFAAASTYDLEVWLPGQRAYREISSCSNCTDFQARRAQIRCRAGGAGGDSKHKPRLVHTLNGSGLAVGRTLVAVLENYQQADGTIAVPKVLQPYLGDMKVIGPEPLY